MKKPIKRISVPHGRGMFLNENDGYQLIQTYPGSKPLGTKFYRAWLSNFDMSEMYSNERVGDERINTFIGSELIKNKKFFKKL